MTRTVQRMARAAFAVMFVIATVGALQGAAWADEKDDARKLLAAGDKFLKRGDYNRSKGREVKAIEEFERALASYEKAFDLVPNPQIYFPIATAEERLGRHMAAYTHYAKLLAEGGELSEELVTVIKERIDGLRMHLSVLKLEITPDGASVAIDGVEVGVAPLDKEMFFEPGEHTVTVTAEGFTPYEQQLPLQAAAESKIPIDLAPIPVIVEKPVARKKRSQVVRAVVPKRPLYIGVGVTGGMAAFATLTGIVATSKHGTYSDMTLPDAERDAARSSGKNYALVTDLLLVGTIAAGAYTAYYYYKVYKPKRAAALRDSRGSGKSLDDALEDEDEDEDAGEEEEVEQDDEGASERDARRRQLWIAPYAAADSLGVAAGWRF